MELIQIYNRATNTWSDRYTPSVGYQENYVLDKTTDTAKDISFKYVSNTAPNWGITDWVRILHVDSAAEAATYDANGRPVNSTQYIISDIEKVQNLKLGYWQIKIVLAEPIERFQGVIGETLTYTNQGDKAVYDPDTSTTTTYYHEPYNYYTALERWLKVTPANCDSYDSGYSAAANRSWFNRIKLLATDKTMLTAITFADTTLNAVSLYELLLDNYDAAVGRTPVAYFDINPSTDLPYNPARDEYLVIFERQDGFGKDEITLSALKASTSGSSILTGYSESASLDNYATGLVSDVENLAVEDGIDYPNQNTYAVPEVNADVRKIDDYDNAGDYWIIKTPFPIKKVIAIKEISMRAETGMNIGDVYPFIDTPISCSAITSVADKTNRCYEIKEYNALYGDIFNSNDLFYYTENESKIHCKNYRYYELPRDDYGRSNWTTYAYLVTYQPYINPRVIIGSDEYLKSINTTYSQVDNKKFADFLEDYLKGMNKADVVIQKTYYNYNDFSELIGTRVIDGEKEYMITNVSYRNRQFQYEVFLQLNENHVRKNNNYQAPGNVQKNAAIATSNIKERKICMQNKIKIGLSPLSEYDISVHLTDAQDSDYDNYSGKLAVISALVPNYVINNTPQAAMVIARSTLEANGGQANNRAAQTVYSQYDPNGNPKFFGQEDEIPLNTSVTPLDEYCYTVEGDGVFLGFGTWYMPSGLIYASERADYHFCKVTCVDIAKFAFGNKICLNVTMPDNAVAGKTKTIDTVVTAVDGDNYKYHLVDTTSPKYQIPVLYSDYFGEIQKLTIALFDTTTESIKNYNYNDIHKNGLQDPEFEIALAATAKIKDIYHYWGKMPAQEVSDLDRLDGHTLVSFDNQNVYKDELERLNETVMFEIDGGKDIIVCDNLAKCSRLMIPDDNGTSGDGTAYIQFFSQKVTQEDLSTATTITGYTPTYNVSESTSGNYIEYTFTALTEVQKNQLKAIAIYIERPPKDREPLLIINKISDIMKIDLANGKLKIYY